MSGRKRKRRGSGGRGGEDEDEKDDDNASSAFKKAKAEFKEFVSDVESAGSSFLALGAKFVQNVDEVKRAQAGFQKLSGAYGFSELEQALPGQSGALEAIRKNLGQIGSEGSALAELQSYAEQSAAAGFKPTKEELGSFVLPLIQRQNAMQQARQDAADVMHDLTGGTGVKSLAKEIAEAVATEVGAALRAALTVWKTW